ncbi:MAG: hypothetical protein AB7O96_20285, partial [Pseudobdellovibrionaceae bacterium]
MKMIGVFFAILLLCSCTSANKPKPAVPVNALTGVPLPAPKDAEAVVTFGVSSYVTFTPNNELFFNSSGRLGHAQAQIYSYDSNTKLEKRWTYT